MKRFYCTICGHIKRVRSLPNNVAEIHSDDVSSRKGTCKWHDPMAITAKARKLASVNKGGK